MKDIDFDELDRAVSSVLGKEAQPAVAAPVASPEPVAEQVSVTVAPAVPVVRETPTVTAPADRPTPSLATPNRGKFMDVVHPSSDMRPAEKTSLPPAAPRVIQPVHREVEATPPPVIEESNVVEPAIAEDKIVETAPAEVDPVLAEVENLEAEEPIVTSEPFQPTPFLTDTKVDKRPLGSFADEKSDENELLLTAHIESDALPSPEQETTPKPLEELSESEPVVTPAEATPATQPASVSAEPEDETSHPLFDTSTYHEPMSPVVAKKKTSPMVWWLLGLGGCLVVGSGVGYFLFTSGL